MTLIRYKKVTATKFIFQTEAGKQYQSASDIPVFFKPVLENLSTRAYEHPGFIVLLQTCDLKLKFISND
jgi:hypothetical protein